MSKPIQLWGYVIIQEGDEVRVTFSYAPIARATQALHGFHGVARTVILRNLARRIISFGVIDDENICRERIEIAYGCEAPVKEIGALASADDNGGGNWGLA